LTFERVYQAAEKIPRAREMIVGVFVNGSFEGDFDL
jgi:hypothetical protein